MGYSPFMLAFGCALPCLGIGIVLYLVKLWLDSHGQDNEPRKQEPEYVRELNRKLAFNKVETERDLF